MAEPERLRPAPEEWRRARELQREYADFDEDQAAEAARQLAADCRDGGWMRADGTPDVRGYLNDLAASRPVEPSREGRPFAFWSYESAPDEQTPPVRHRFLAQACAERRGYAVLETTPTGRLVDSYRLAEPEVSRTLIRHYQVDETEIEAARDEVWHALSRSYAEAARGEVQVFAADVAAGSVLGREELPRLRADPQVGVEGIRFAVEAPRHAHLPADVDRLLGRDAVRAQLTLEDHRPEGPDAEHRSRTGVPAHLPPPQALAHRLDRIALPPDLRTERDQAAARLRSATTYTDLHDHGTAPERPAMDESTEAPREHGPAAPEPDPTADPHRRGDTPGAVPAPPGPRDTAALLARIRARPEETASPHGALPDERVPRTAHEAPAPEQEHGPAPGGAELLDRIRAGAPRPRDTASPHTALPRQHREPDHDQGIGR